MKKCFVFFTFFCCLIISCQESELKNCGETHVTYTSHIQEIFERSCNNVDCHIGAQSGWAVLPDFSTYDALFPYLESGKIAERVFAKDSFNLMPPFNRPERQLPASDLALISCWLEDGFPEN